MTEIISYTVAIVNRGVGKLVTTIKRNKTCRQILIRIFHRRKLLRKHGCEWKDIIIRETAGEEVYLTDVSRDTVKMVINRVSSVTSRPMPNFWNNWASSNCLQVFDHYLRDSYLTAYWLRKFHNKLMKQVVTYQKKT